MRSTSKTEASGRTVCIVCANRFTEVIISYSL